MISIREGKKVRFRALKQSDVDAGWAEWFNDSEVTQFMERGAYPHTDVGQRKFLDYISTSEKDVVFALEPVGKTEFVGVVGIRNISWMVRKAELSVVIGKKEWWGKGLGTEAFALAADHAFEALNLNRLMVAIDVSNAASLKSVEKAGFKKMGVGRSVYYKNGEYRDAMYLDLLRSEWEKKK